MTTQPVTTTLFDQMKSAFEMGPDALVHWLYDLKLYHPTVKAETLTPRRGKAPQIGAIGYASTRVPRDDDDAFHTPRTIKNSHLGTITDVGCDISPNNSTFYLVMVKPREIAPIKIYLNAICNLDVCP